MPEDKDSTQDVEEMSGKDNASTTSSDQENLEEKKDKKENQKEIKEQKNTRIIKKIIKGSKKAEKNASTKFEEGVSFRGKLIGVEDVNSARGDKICQDSLQKLKAMVKSSGEHKQKIIMSVSFQGIKITSEKTNEVLYHHPVHMISFTSLDVNDSRAFGYICGTAEEGHKFVAIKTEKAACQVVLTLQDLFQTVLEKKKQAMESAKKLHTKVATEDKTDNQASDKETLVESQEVQEQEEALQKDQAPATKNATDTAAPDADSTFKAFPTPTPTQSNIDDLLCLQLEVDQLQEGIAQMDNSMAAIGVTQEPFYDPFNTSFVLYPQPVDAFESSTTSSASSEEQSAKFPLQSSSQINPEAQETSSFYITYNGNDKYSALTKIDTSPSIFETSQVSNGLTNADDKITFDAFSPVGSSDKVPPPKPVRSPPKEDNLFADLDPLGKDRPFLDKKDFFYDLKNPPKKLLKDLVDSSRGNEGSSFYTSVQSATESTEVSKVSETSDICPPFPCDFSNISPPQVSLQSSDALSSSPNITTFQRVLSDSTRKDSLPLQMANPLNPFNNTIPILPPPPVPPRLSTRASEPNIKVPGIGIRSENTNNVVPSSNVPAKMSPNQRRGSLPLSQLQSDLACHENAYQSSNNNNESLVGNSSHPIPIPPRKLVTNFQHNSFNSFNGRSLDNEFNRTPSSLEAETPPVTDLFGQNLNDVVTNNTKFGVSTASRDRRSPMLKQCNRSSSCIIPETHLTNGSSPHSKSVGAISLSLENGQSIWAHEINSNSNDKSCLMNSDSTSSSPLNTDKTVRSPTVPLCENFPNEQVPETISTNEHGQKLNGVLSCAKSTKFSSSGASVFSSSGSIFNRKLDPFADDFFAAPKKFNEYQRVPNEL